MVQINHILIAGPTASGKSAYALKLAQGLKTMENIDCVIINTDSMQIYDVLRVITARPPAEDEALLPHKLYGHVQPDQIYSVANWLEDVAPLLSELYKENKLPIFVGGTGLYFKALIEGFAAIPSVPSEVREFWRGEGEVKSAFALHAILSEQDPNAAQQIKSNDMQRILRALEVMQATKRSITEWQGENEAPLIDGQNAKKIVLMPARDVLYERINARFAKMFSSGAVDEVKALTALDLDPTCSAMKAIGVPQIQAFLAGEMSEQEAIDKAAQATRNYAKRQMTWFRNQLDDSWKRVE